MRSILLVIHKEPEEYRRRRKFLAHGRMNREPGNDGNRKGENNQAQDEEGCLFTRLLRRSGDAEGIDEGIREKVEQLHCLIMRYCCCIVEASCRIS